MARLRIFVSSTYYDLKHFRSSLEVMIEDMGFEPVLFERGDITYHPDSALDESCYAELATCDLVILILGGRYGSPTSAQTEKEDPKDLNSRLQYESITKKEHKTALEKGLPVYTLIDRPVFNEYQTYKKNRGKDINWAFVDSPDLFTFIEDISSLGLGNSIQPFERFAEVESYLKEQWSGLFRDLLNKRSVQRELASLEANVNQLSQVSQTIEKYLENVLRKVNEDDAAEIIKSERKRRSDSALESASRSHYITQYHERWSVDPLDLTKAFTEAKDVDDLESRLKKVFSSVSPPVTLNGEAVVRRANNVRTLMGDLEPLPAPSADRKFTVSNTKSKQKIPVVERSPDKQK